MIKTQDIIGGETVLGAGRFVPIYSDLTSLLADLTKKQVPNLVQWTDQCWWAFVRVKAALCGGPFSSLTFISLLCWRPMFQRAGSILSQVMQGVDWPVLYIRRKFSVCTSTIEVQHCGEGVLAFKWVILTVRYRVPIPRCSCSNAWRMPAHRSLIGIWHYSPLTSVLSTRYNKRPQSDQLHLPPRPDGFPDRVRQWGCCGRWGHSLEGVCSGIVWKYTNYRGIPVFHL